MPTTSHTPPEDQRILLYRGLAYRRLPDGVSAALPDGRFEAIPAAAVPLPVARALGLAERAAGWLPRQRASRDGSPA